MKKLTITIGVITALIWAGVLGAACAPEDDAGSTDETYVSIDEDLSTGGAEEVTTTTRATTTTTRATTTTSAMSMGERNAVRKAEAYLEFQSFSRKGLIDQLEFEGFSTADSTFAVDYIDVDWNEQAALKAASYLEFQSFSRSGLIDQLEFEGFTPAQAEYGVTAVGY